MIVYATLSDYARTAIRCGDTLNLPLHGLSYAQQERVRDILVDMVGDPRRITLTNMDVLSCKLMGEDVDEAVRDAFKVIDDVAQTPLLASASPNAPDHHPVQTGAGKKRYGRKQR